MLVRSISSEEINYYDFFLIKDSKNPKQCLLDAIQHFLETEEGKVAIEQTSRDFNWGDSVLYVPEEIWNQYGVKSVVSGEKIEFNDPYVIYVDQDEVLIPN